MPSDRRADEPANAPPAYRDISTVAEVAYAWDLASDAIAWGAGLADVVGFAVPEATATGLDYAGFLSPLSETSRYEAVLAMGGCDTGEGVAFRVVYGLTPDPRAGAAPTWVEDTGRWFADAGGRPVSVRGVLRTLNVEQEAERAHAIAAQRDPLTGVMNQRHFLGHVERHLKLGARKRISFAVVLVDVARVGEGPAVTPTDAVIVAAAAGLRRQVRMTEALARLDKSRFAILLEDCNGEQIANAAARLIAGVEAEHDLSVRIGGVVAPLHGRTPSALLEHAQEALSAADRGLAAFACYDPETARRAAEAALPTVADEIVAALNEGRVVLALQPVVDAKTRVAASAEALVHVRRRDGTLLSPDVLMPAAEAGCLTALLDRRVLDLAFAHLLAEPKALLSINAAVASLLDPEWQAHLRAAGIRHRGAASRLTVEIAEAGAVADFDAVGQALLALRETGVRTAIDDVRSGASAFRHLRTLPLDCLKLDGALARALARTPDDGIDLSALVDLSRSLRVPIVAEWIEDEATARMLADRGVDLLQGHLFNRADAAMRFAAVA